MRFIWKCMCVFFYFGEKVESFIVTWRRRSYVGAIWCVTKEFGWFKDLCYVGTALVRLEIFLFRNMIRHIWPEGQWHNAPVKLSCPHPPPPFLRVPRPFLSHAYFSWPRGCPRTIWPAHYFTCEMTSINNVWKKILICSPGSNISLSVMVTIFVHFCVSVNLHNLLYPFYITNGQSSSSTIQTWGLIRGCPARWQSME